MSQAVQMAVDAALASGGKQVVRVRLKVGALSGAAPESLRFAFDVVASGTIAAGASLEIETVPVAWWCRACHAEFSSGIGGNECPRCREWSGELRRGNELELDAVEVT